NDLADFYGNVEVVDQTIGLLFDTLESLRLMEDTMFIYTTDHGIPFPRAKCTLYDPGLKTSLIMYHKNSKEFTGGRTINSLISNIDLLPSLLDYIGAKLPDKIEGKSFLPILRNQTKKIRSEIYAEKTFHEIYDPIRGIRTNQYKYIKNFEKSGTLYQIPTDILRDPSGQVMKEKYNKIRLKEELYDLTVDPFEENNLIENYEYKNILNEMRKKLNAWMKETKDPLLKGKVIDKRQEVQKHY
ncbi:MAG: sulfatase-like hydrolase/transferase, partial [Candidatus Lokiarchaeota archaeon]